MTLGELIEMMEGLEGRPVTYGFGRPHSYRGFYSDLAFEPVRSTSVSDMLTAARSALGATFEGYKGGQYTMREYTDVWLARQGETGETIGPELLGFMVLGRPLGHRYRWDDDS